MNLSKSYFIKLVGKNKLKVDLKKFIILKIHCYK